MERDVDVGSGVLVHNEDAFGHSLARADIAGKRPRVGHCGYEGGVRKPPDIHVLGKFQEQIDQSQVFSVSWYCGRAH